MTLTEKISCQNAENLISRMMDGELSSTEIRKLDEHLSICPKCQRTAWRYQAVKGLLDEELRDSAERLPAAPAIPREHRFNVKFLRPLTLAAAMIAALLLGRWWGATERQKPPIAARVAAPVIWSGSAEPAKREAALSAQPLTRQIELYQQTVASELARDEVDWDRLRRLVETMGALRTDLELLSLHVAFIEREMGGAPRESERLWTELLLEGRTSH